MIRYLTSLSLGQNRNNRSRPRIERHISFFVSHHLLQQQQQHRSFGKTKSPVLYAVRCARCTLYAVYCYTHDFLTTSQLLYIAVYHILRSIYMQTRSGTFSTSVSLSRSHRGGRKGHDTKEDEGRELHPERTTELPRAPQAYARAAGRGIFNQHHALILPAHI